MFLIWPFSKWPWSCIICTWRNSLKNLLLQNCWSDLEIILLECSLGDPFQKMFAKFWSVHIHGFVEWGLLAIYGQEEILNKSSSLKPLVRFWNNFTGMFLGWPFSKMFSKFWSVNKHGISECGLLALYGHKEILVNSYLKVTRKLAMVLSKIQVSDPRPSWPSCCLVTSISPFPTQFSKGLFFEILKTVLVQC